MTVIVDDAGSGDLLFGIVIGAYRPETAEFKYDVIGVRFFQPNQYCTKGYLTEASRITSELLATLKAKPDRTLAITKGAGGVSVDNAKVVKADVMTDNGIIHVIDTVLLPSK